MDGILGIDRGCILELSLSSKGIEMYLMICAWCKPLNKLRGSHGICPTHKEQMLKELKDV